MAICPFQFHCQTPAPVPLPNPIHHFPKNLAPLLSQTSSFSPCSAATTETRFEWESRNRMFILGMGFVGQFFAKNLKNEDWVVNGTCTSSTKLKELEERGFDVCRFYANEPELVPYTITINFGHQSKPHSSESIINEIVSRVSIRMSSMSRLDSSPAWTLVCNVFIATGASPLLSVVPLIYSLLDVVTTLKSYTHLLVSIPSVAGVGDPMLQHRELLRSMLMGGDLQWLGYLSSTSVYGHSGGAWVDEDYPASPTSETGKLRLVAEEGWLNLGRDLGLSTQVFRLGGIYGPHRSAVDTIIKQEALSKTQEFRLSRQYTSRVHVQDICQTLHASINLPSSRRIYNIVDDDPAPREEVFAYAKELVEQKWPGLVKLGTSREGSVISSKKVSSRDEKRVSNARIKSELGVKLVHPSYRSGLLSIIDQMESPFRYSSSWQPIL